MSDLHIVDNYEKTGESINTLIDFWTEKLKNAQEGHYKETESLNKTHSRIGVGLIFLTTIITAFIFYEPIEYKNEIKLALGMSSAIAVTLSGIVSFGRFSERANEHRITASRYGKLRRQLEYLKATNPELNQQNDSKQKLKLLRIEWEYIASTAPLTPKK
ncbi:SLATT domain-containing protein [Photobacterium phosphoreum]|uniref:SLATT domain-containing protein n=2 Tax=Photobacterium phosphoreum TaxID=659 RepID=A0AAW4ZWN0_PHOPO|nr:SLATT domain-containing protein [Photobacterium phosphoreum]MCF2189543.1 SLATT domain-containing protein [Photobacterium phosphoreum]MCF2301449.1 SLATT domain-containing protein [Photobacterium phosphoreum]